MGKDTDMKGRLKIKDGKFYCGFCGDITETDVYTSGEKGAVSNQIICKKCGRHIAQRNQLK